MGGSVARKNGLADGRESATDLWREYPDHCLGARVRPGLPVTTEHIVWTTTQITNQGDLPPILLSSYTLGNPNPCP
jgi:hypothetical protein